ncbi:MAG: aminodeoxychorismate synthase component I [Bacteroidota bacterium]
MNSNPANTNYKDWAAQLNRLGAERTPCFFLIDFKASEAKIWKTEELDARHVQFNFHGRGNDLSLPPPSDTELIAKAYFPKPEHYRIAFNIVEAGLKRGDSFLTNLTFPVPVELATDLYKVYAASRAPYRIWWKDNLACFSPETFVRIDEHGRISSNPMKGTALDQPGAAEKLISNHKEVAEHATIVDLIRNDLSRVATQVSVARYRYLDRLESPEGALLQTSSEIVGQLDDDWRSRLGTLLAGLLPAGSISGAPKPATLDIIRRAENRSRWYYCGIGGYFDGHKLDSCVLIRLIQQLSPMAHLFWAGGGITARSNWEDEYAELCAKVRVPRRSFSEV